MPYEAITDEAEVAQLFEGLRGVFQTDGREDGKSYGNPRYCHQDREGLWSAFGHQEISNRNAHFIGFGRGNGTITIFEVNPPAKGTDGRMGEGLFVQGDGGNKYLTHSGNLRLSAESNGNRETYASS